MAAQDLLRVVGFVGDDQTLRRLAAQVEGREHPWQQADRLVSRSEERTREPGVSLCRLAEAREIAFDSGEVLQVG